MPTRTRAIAASPEKVWDILADGWLYPLWFVGATAMWSVDASWPAVGAELVHESGTWPIALDEQTTVLDCEPGRRLAIAVRGKVLGETHVALELRPAGDGTELSIDPQPVGGLRKLVPGPLRRRVVSAWADECLVRVGLLAERRG